MYLYRYMYMYMYLYDHPTSRLCVGLGFAKARKQASKKAPWHQALTQVRLAQVYRYMYL